MSVECSQQRENGSSIRNTQQQSNREARRKERKKKKKEGTSCKARAQSVEGNLGVRRGAWETAENGKKASSANDVHFLHSLTFCSALPAISRMHRP